MFTPYPAVTQSDPAQQAFAQMLGGYKPNQLGAGVTLGNPEAQQDYIAQLAQALADGDAGQKMMDQAGGIKDSGWIDNSGWVGVLEQVSNAYFGKKMDEKARALQADAETRRMTAQEQLDERKATRDLERTEKVTTRERTRRQSLASQMGLSNREAVEFIETGKVPNAQRGEFVETANGIMYGDPYTGKLGDVNQGGQRQAQGPQVNFEGDVPDEVKRHILANQDQWEGGGTVTIPEQQGGRIMPYEKPPSAIEIERLRLQQEAAGRAGQAADDARAIRNEAADNKRNAAYDAEDKAATKARTSVALIDQVLRHPGRETGTGLSSVLDPRNYVPGTDAKDFEIARKQLEGRAFLEAFESLKGGGQITQVEGEKATAAMGRLSSAQSDAEFESALRELQGIFGVAADAADQRKQRYGQPQQSQPSQSNEAPTQRIRIKL